MKRKKKIDSVTRTQQKKKKKKNWAIGNWLIFIEFKRYTKTVGKKKKNTLKKKKDTHLTNSDLSNSNQ